ncbi:MAG: hypothetical protein ACR2NY_02445 [Alphaproteobacteria bacterium]
MVNIASLSHIKQFNYLRNIIMSKNKVLTWIKKRKKLILISSATIILFSIILYFGIILYNLEFNRKYSTYSLKRCNYINVPQAELGQISNINLIEECLTRIEQLIYTPTIGEQSEKSYLKYTAWPRLNMAKKIVNYHNNCLEIKYYIHDKRYIKSCLSLAQSIAFGESMLDCSLCTDIQQFYNKERVPYWKRQLLK